jgi:hypothetical protein
MAWGDPSNPARFLYGQSASDERNLALKVFGGEVLAAFDLNTVTLDKHQTRSVRGKSAQFPKTWKATSEYFRPGQEMLGNDIDTTEITITVDDILVSHVAISDLDAMLSHFDVRSQFSTELGRALARVFDKNVFRQIVLAARTAADGPFPGGIVVTDAALTNSGTISGIDWIEAIRSANISLFNNDVPEEAARYMAVNRNVFDAIKYAKDANGNYLVLNRDFQAANGGGISGRIGESLQIDGVTIYPSRNMPTTNETSDTTVYSKYRGNYSTTTGVLWTPMSVATTKVMDMALETTRDVRRQEDFMVAKMLVGHGTLRPEATVEFKTS